VGKKGVDGGNLGNQISGGGKKFGGEKRLQEEPLREKYLVSRKKERVSKRGGKIWVAMRGEVLKTHDVRALCA